MELGITWISINFNFCINWIFVIFIICNKNTFVSSLIKSWPNKCWLLLFLYSSGGFDFPLSWLFLFLIMLLLPSFSFFYLSIFFIFFNCLQREEHTIYIILLSNLDASSSRNHNEMSLSIIKDEYCLLTLLHFLLNLKKSFTTGSQFYFFAFSVHFSQFTDIIDNVFCQCGGTDEVHQTYHSPLGQCCHSKKIPLVIPTVNLSYKFCEKHWSEHREPPYRNI